VAAEHSFHLPPSSTQQALTHLITLTHSLTHSLTTLALTTIFTHSPMAGISNTTSATPRSVRIQDLGRTAISRHQSHSLAILDEVESGENSNSWCACCAAPACCSTLGALPCFQNPEYITLRYESSKYIYVRENSLEWNEPKVSNV
jgi:hypothetical protein